MDKKEKIETEEKEEKCCCGKDCKCGCCCNKKVTIKILAMLIIFLAGMGFHALLQCGFRCPSKAPRPMPMPMMNAPVPMPTPSFTDGQAGNIIIINTDGSAGVEKFLGRPEGCNCGKDCGCNKGKPCDGFKDRIPGDKMNPDKMQHKGDRFGPKDNMPAPAPKQPAPNHGGSVK